MLLDYFASTVGKPKRTIAWGSSLGGMHTALLLQKFPQRFDGGVSISGNGDGALGLWNMRFDPLFVIKALLSGAADLEIVNISDPDMAIAQARQIVAQPQETPAGRARMPAAVGDLPGWFDPASPPPATDEYLAQEVDQFKWLNTATLGVYITLRWETEQRAGGNPSLNIGIDYREQLERSIDRDEVYALRQTAGATWTPTCRSWRLRRASRLTLLRRAT